MSTEWYEIESGAVAAVTAEGLFLLPCGETRWRWHPFGSDGWDAIHQRIYRQHRAERLPARPDAAPPLPEPGPPTPPHDRDDPGAMARHPGLLAWVGSGRTAFLTLCEDPYESLVGDGLFRYVVGCFPNEVDARSCALPTGNARHLRRIVLGVEGDGLRATGERVDFADRYEMSSVLADLADRIGG